MPRGGARKGAGRKAGAATKRTREIADKLMAEGLTPLDYMLSILRGQVEFDENRFEAAKCAAPYCHPRLVAAKVESEVKVTLLDLLLAIPTREATADEQSARH